MSTIMHIEFRSVCHVRLHYLSRIKNYFHTFIFLTIYVFLFLPLFFLVALFLSVSPFVHCFSFVCPCFRCFPLVFTVLICFLLLSHVFPVFLAVCFPLFHCYYLFSTVSRYFVFQFSLVLPCFSGFSFLFLVYCVFLCFHG